LKVKTAYETFRVNMKDNIKIKFKDMVCKDVDSIYVAQNTVSRSCEHGDESSEYIKNS
jgi:hypothetical protein